MEDRYAELIQIARKHNNTVYEDDINELFEEPEEVESVYKRLKDEGYHVIINTYEEEDFTYTSKINLVNLYMQQIAKVPLLTPEEEYDLGVRIKNGDEEAKKLMVEANLRLVVYIARRYAENPSMSLMDLIQEGNIGLMEAAKRFDPDKGFRFSTYAAWWIKQAISKSLIEYSRTIRIPSHAVDAINKIKKADYDLGQTLGREPTPEELSEATGIEVEKIVELQSVAKTPISLDNTVNDDNDTDVMDLVADTTNQTPEEYARSQSEREAVIQILDTLDSKEKEVLMRRYGLDDGRIKTLDEIGQGLVLTRERVRQIEVKAMRKLRQPARAMAIRSILWGESEGVVYD